MAVLPLNWGSLAHLSAVLSPADAAGATAPLSAATCQRLEYLYAKGYEPELDLRVLWRG